MASVIDGIDHVGVVVSDMDQSIDFYSKHLGFLLLARYTSERLSSGDGLCQGSRPVRGQTGALVLGKPTSRRGHLRAQDRDKRDCIESDRCR